MLELSVMSELPSCRCTLTLNEHITIVRLGARGIEDVNIREQDLALWVRAEDLISLWLQAIVEFNGVNWTDVTGSSLVGALSLVRLHGPGNWRLFDSCRRHDDVRLSKESKCQRE